jgi:hypothetical protein
MKSTRITGTVNLSVGWVKIPSKINDISNCSEVRQGNRNVETFSDYES